MSTKKKKCKNCGRTFIPESRGEQYCSPLCAATGKFVGGGGDTTKPMNPEQRKAMERKGVVPPPPSPQPSPRPIRNGIEKFPRVAQMFALPVSERWSVARHFTEEEREFARRMAKRMLSDERRMDMICSWDGEGDEGEANDLDVVRATIGDSDDGTV